MGEVEVLKEEEFSDDSAMSLRGEVPLMGERLILITLLTHH